MSVRISRVTRPNLPRGIQSTSYYSKQWLSTHQGCRVCSGCLRHHGASLRERPRNGYQISIHCTVYLKQNSTETHLLATRTKLSHWLKFANWVSEWRIFVTRRVYLPCIYHFTGQRISKPDWSRTGCWSIPPLCLLVRTDLSCQGTSGPPYPTCNRGLSGAAKQRKLCSAIRTSLPVKVAPTSYAV